MARGTTDPVTRSASPSGGDLRVPRWHDARPAERLGYAVGLGLMAVGVLHALVFLVDGGAWQGPASWRKPTTFGLSFGLTVVTLTWLTTALRMRDRTRWTLLGTLAVANVVEVGAVVLQAWRGVPSHFNQGTPFDGAVFATMGISVAFIAAVIVAVTVLAFTSIDAPRPTRLAIRLGLLALVAAQAIGGAMIGQGLAELAADDQAAAYVAGGTLKLAHAVTMHGVQLLPILAVLLAWAGIAEARRSRAVLVAAVGHVLVALAALASPLDVGVPVAVTALVLGLAVLVAVAAWTAAAVLGARAGRTTARR